MTKTRKKLEEAAFFLQKLKSSRDNFKEFKCYLSAYISSARSVLWIMRYEYHNIKGWEEWFKSKEEDDEVKRLFGIITKARNLSQKQEPLKLSGYFQFNLPKDLYEILKPCKRLKIEDMRQQMSEADFEKFKTYFKKEMHEKTKLYYILEDLEGDITEATIVSLDILEICKKYYSTLENIVSECEDIFSPKKGTV